MGNRTQQYDDARQRFSDWGVDADKALTLARQIPISIHCWQGDDVTGFEPETGALGNGLAVTGSYPGRARTADELRADFACAASLIPGAKRFNLHALYAETGGVPVDRDALAPLHFQAWMDWAKENRFGLDFNPSFFSHPLAAGGLTLTHPDAAIRNFWVNHGMACRRIADAMGRHLGSPCVNNVWIPDGYKDLPADRAAPRERLRESLDRCFEKKYGNVIDTVESKLFGIGSESYVAGSHEFYMGYAITRGIGLCLDAGHFHPTEGLADKISAIIPWIPRLLLHVSRGVRWDSDHVVILNDDLLATTQEIVRGGYLDKTSIGLDFFDASINRIAAWVIGARALRKALLVALLEPVARLREAENAGDFTSRLAWMEECKWLPYATIWERLCELEDMPAGAAWLDQVRRYEADVLAKRN